MSDAGDSADNNGSQPSNAGSKLIIADDIDADVELPEELQQSKELEQPAWLGSFDSNEYRERQRLIAREREAFFISLDATWSGKGPKAKRAKAVKKKKQQVDVIFKHPVDSSDTMRPGHLKKVMVKC